MKALAKVKYERGTATHVNLQDGDIGTNGSRADWNVVALRECGRWLSGGTPNTGEPKYWNGNIPWITASSLQDFRIKTSERKLTNLGLENGSWLVPKGSILFVVRGMSLKTEFRIGIAQNAVAFGQDCKAVVPNESFDSQFLAYAIRSKSDEILGLVDEAGHGTGRLQTDVLEKLEIPRPPFAEQKAIAAVFGALDDKIANNTALNHHLAAASATDSAPDISRGSSVSRRAARVRD